MFDQLITFGDALLLFLLYAVGTLVFESFQQYFRRKKFDEETEILRHFHDHNQEYVWEEIQFRHGKLYGKLKK